MADAHKRRFDVDLHVLGGWGTFVAVKILGCHNPAVFSRAFVRFLHPGRLYRGAPDVFAEVPFFNLPGAQVALFYLGPWFSPHRPSPPHPAASPSLNTPYMRPTDHQTKKTSPLSPGSRARAYTLARGVF